LRRAKNAIPFLILLTLTSSAIFPIVRAQTTSIVDVTYPRHATFDLERRTADPPLLVSATIAYSQAREGYFLVVGVFDLDSGDLVKGSGGVSSGECDAGYARCLADVKSDSGVEVVQFLVAGYKPTMSMAIIAVLFDDSKNMIYDSESDFEFVISMTATLSLSVIAPGDVVVIVDGNPQPNGSTHLNLVPGKHAVSVPEIVQVSNFTRLRFKGWADGNNQTDRTISLTYGTALTAVYVTQYWLNAANAQGCACLSTGNGWYDEATVASFSVESTSLPMDGVLGLIGAKWVLQGWYENGELLTRSKNGTITMLNPHFVTARWAPDFTLPLVGLAVAAVLAIGLDVRARGHRSLMRKNPAKSRRGDLGSGKA